MIAQLSDAGVRWHKYVRLARLHRRLWGQMLQWALRRGHEAVAGGVFFAVAAAQPAAISSVTPHPRRGIGVKLGLTRRGEGALRDTCGDKRPGGLQSRSRLPVLFRRMWRVGGLRGS